MKQVILFINGGLGLNLLDYLLQREDTNVRAVVINGPNKVNPEFKTNVVEKLAGSSHELKVFQYSQDLWESPDFSEYLSTQPFGISALFGHIIPENVINRFDGNLINLHPSLLPIGRGADPVFWSMVEELPQGATIHRIDKGIDTGDIFVQAEIKSDFQMNSGDIYEKVIDTLFRLFTEFYPSWNASTVSTPQIGRSTYHAVNELARIKSRLLETPEALLKELNLIRALTYNDHRKATIKLPNKEVWEVTLQARRIQG
jgi:methionyl-tRNA formyltransferase